MNYISYRRQDVCTTITFRGSLQLCSSSNGGARFDASPALPRILKAAQAPTLGVTWLAGVTRVAVEQPRSLEAYGRQEVTTPGPLSKPFPLSPPSSNLHHTLLVPDLTQTINQQQTYTYYKLSSCNCPTPAYQQPD
jgi:hypothetical protein